MRTFWIACACVSTCLIPVIAGWIWRRKYQKMRPVWMGVLGFFAFAGIAEMLFVMLCLSALGPVSRALNANTLRLVVFSCLCAGLFEEAGRYAIGHFGVEILVLTVWPLLSRSPEAFGLAQAALTLWERLAACAGHTALSVLVWYAFCEKKPGVLVLAVALHAVCDAPLGFLRYGAMGTGLAEVLFAVFIVILGIIAFGYWRKLPGGAMIREE